MPRRAQASLACPVCGVKIRGPGRPCFSGDRSESDPENLSTRATSRRGRAGPFPCSKALCQAHLPGSPLAGLLRDSSPPPSGLPVCHHLPVSPPSCPPALGSWWRSLGEPACCPSQRSTCRADPPVMGDPGSQRVKKLAVQSLLHETALLFLFSSESEQSSNWMCFLFPFGSWALQISFPEVWGIRDFISTRQVGK